MAFGFSSLLGWAAIAGNVLIVAPSGGNYVQIQPAVDAASDGDTILVRSGLYRPFTIIDKALSVVADTGASVEVASPVQVMGLSIDRDVILAGITISAHPGTALDLEFDLGSVRVEGCELSGYSCNQTPSCFSGGGAYLRDCTDVSFAHCVITAGSGGWGEDGIYAWNSKCAVYDGSSRGGSSSDGVGDASCSPPTGGSGAYLDASFLFASGSDFQGGDGGMGGVGALGCTCGNDSGGGGCGVLSFSTWSSARLLDDTYIPGHGAPSAGCGGCCATWGECCPGQDGSGAGGHDVGFLAGRARHLAIENPQRELTTFPVQVQGRPGDDVYLFVSDRTTFRYVSGYRGVQLTQQPAPPIHLGIIGAGGTLTRPFSFPDLGPGVQSKPYFLQAALHTPSGGWTLTGPVSLVVLDQAF